MRRNNHGADVKIGCWLRTYIIDPTEILVIYDGIPRFECRLLFDATYYESWKLRLAAIDLPLPPRLRDWPYVGDGSTINPQWIRDFLKKCCNAHLDGLHSLSNGCGARSTHLKPMKLDLIDVRRLCLVEADTTARYTSLSYVWGQVEVLRATKENRQALMQPRVFEKFYPAPLVQDAIELVRMIGEQYLWVDSLCIPQNDTKLTAFYVNRMDYIYSQSVLTIIAASSRSAMDHLPGVRPGSRSPQHTPKIGNMRLVVRTRELDAPLEESIYESRAWTFQERLLSNRCLIMTDLEAFLCCPSLLFSELHGSLPEACKRFHPLRQLTHSRAKYESQRDMLSYRDLVVSFTRRQLTYETDILRAFAGISAFLEAKMPHGRMLFGLPTTDIALALSWVSRGPTSRRYTCASPDGAKEFALPSWTWAGWTGRKDWLPPFAWLEHDEMSFPSLVSHMRDCEIGDGVLWEEIYVETPTRLTSSTPSILRFTALQLQASQFRFRKFEKEALTTQHRDTTRYYPLDLPVLEITGHIHGGHVQGGLVFGVEAEQLDDPGTTFIALGRWNRTDLPTGYDFNRSSQPDSLYYVSLKSFQVCLVARWTDQEQTVCKRIGIAHIASHLWDSETSEQAPGVIRLA